MRDASGNVMSTYSENATSLQLEETYIYGSSRIGSYNANLVLGQSAGGNDPIQMVEYFRGQIVYELSNHLGNVLAVITDRKIGSRLSGPGNWEHFEVDYTSFSDYYPFGMLMDGRSFTSVVYRYSFNGKEKDIEGMGGGGSTYDYGFRIYNPQIAKFLSVDPLTASYPWYTPYQFAGNMPIIAIDLDGLEEKIITSALNRPEYMGKMWKIINSSKLLKYYWNSVNQASKLKTHKVYYAIMPKNDRGNNGFTMNHSVLMDLCEDMINPPSNVDKKEMDFYVEFFKLNNLDPSTLIKEGINKQVNLVAINVDLFDKDRHTGNATMTFMHEIIAHLRNNIKGINSSMKMEHLIFFREEDKTEKENYEEYYKEDSPHVYKIMKSNSLAGKIWREIEKKILDIEAKEKLKDTKTEGTENNQ